MPHLNKKSVPETVNTCSGAEAQTVFKKELDCSQTTTTDAEFIFDYASGTITSYSGPGSEVVIPTQIDSVSVMHIGEGVFISGRDDISNVFIADGVQTIGGSTFGDSSLESITIPKSVKSIGEWAFWRTGITSMEIPEGVEVISEGLFRGIFLCTK
jgi:hypothetical protein